MENDAMFTFLILCLVFTFLLLLGLWIGLFLWINQQKKYIVNECSQCVKSYTRMGECKECDPLSEVYDCPIDTECVNNRCLPKE